MPAILAAHPAALGGSRKTGSLLSSLLVFEEKKLGYLETAWHGHELGNGKKRKEKKVAHSWSFQIMIVAEQWKGRNEGNGICIIPFFKIGGFVSWKRALRSGAPQWIMKRGFRKERSRLTRRMNLTA